MINVSSRRDFVSNIMIRKLDVSLQVRNEETEEREEDLDMSQVS